MTAAGDTSERTVDDRFGADPRSGDVGPTTGRRARRLRIPWSVRIGLRGPGTRARPRGDGGTGPLARAFLWCGAVDRELVETRTEHYRLVNLGVFVLLVATLAGVSFTLYVGIITGGFSFVYLFGALLWAVLVFFLDRAIVAEPSYGDLRLSSIPRPGGTVAAPVGAPAGRAAKLLAYGFRVAVAAMIAYLVGEAILLLVFRPEIRQESGVRHDAAFRVAVAEQVEPLSRHVGDLLAQRATAVADRQASLDQQNARRTEFEQEANGTGGSGVAGPGAKTDAAFQRWQAAQTAFAGVDARVQAETTRIDGEVAGAQAAIQAIGNGDTAQVAKLPELQRRREDIYDNTGWVEQEAALRGFLARESGNVTVVAVPWVLRGILFAVDLFPLMLKIAGVNTLYAQRQRDRAAQIRYRDARLDESIRLRADLEADLDQARDGLRHEAAARGEQRRWERAEGRYAGRRRAEEREGESP